MGSYSYLISFWVKFSAKGLEITSFFWSSRLQVSRTSSTLKWSSWSWAMPGPSLITKEPKHCSERAQWASARSGRHSALSLSLSPHTDTWLWESDSETDQAEGKQTSFCLRNSLTSSWTLEWNLWRWISPPSKGEHASILLAFVDDEKPCTHTQRLRLQSVSCT